MDESFNFGWVDGGGGGGLGWVWLGGGGGSGLCGWPDFFVPWFGGYGFCGLVVGNLMVVVFVVLIVVVG